MSGDPSLIILAAVGVIIIALIIYYGWRRWWAPVIAFAIGFAPLIFNNRVLRRLIARMLCSRVVRRLLGRTDRRQLAPFLDAQRRIAYLLDLALRRRLDCPLRSRPGALGSPTLGALVGHCLI